ncbi:MAG: imidazolonepropionase [Candidatus Brocadiia bacterium]
MKKVDLIITDVAELVTVRGYSDKPCSGAGQMNNLGIITNGAIAIHKGIIIEVGFSKDVAKRYRASKTIKATDNVVTPGLIDPHTHPVFAGDRALEFEMRIKGATYQEISAAGGGIRSTVRNTRAATKAELKLNARRYLNNFISHGTTTIEAKSGYGLNLSDEIKILEVINDLNKGKDLPAMVPTFLGAHDIPPEYKDDKAGYVKYLKEKMIPEVSRRHLAEFCDIFCEKGVFEINETRDILMTAHRYGFKLKLHADEFAPLGGAELAAELGAVSADHLMAISDNGIKAMKDKGVIGVILPGTTFALGLKNYAPARKMVDAGLPIALATDFNPGTSMTESMPMIMTIACTLMKLTPAEVLVAATINAAYAIEKQKKVGSLEEGKDADIVIWNAPSYRHIPYHWGVNLAKVVIKKGKMVV